VSGGDPARAIAAAVLYEGYLLWPYRASALKNQQRFTFGGVYPAAFAGASGDRSEIVMECLMEVDDSDARVEVSLRCLHLVERQPLLLAEGAWQPVAELAVGGTRHVAWEEASEREFRSGPLTVSELVSGRSAPARIPAQEVIEPLGDDAYLSRSWETLEGELHTSVGQVAEGILRLSVRFANRSPWSGCERPAALRRTFLSTHFVARGRGAQFISQTDPAPSLTVAAAACRNDGVWPVLVGEPGSRETLLGSPIILGDYPSVAPESPGDLFDGGEIDALLIHSIRGLTDAEQEEMRATDPRAREILERSLALEPEQMLRLYGAVRELRQVQP
jgi:hypothetical protein